MASGSLAASSGYLVQGWKKAVKIADCGEYSEHDDLQILGHVCGGACVGFGRAFGGC